MAVQFRVDTSIWVMRIGYRMQGNAGFFFLIRDLGEILGIHPHDQNVHHLHIERVYIFNLDTHVAGKKLRFGRSGFSVMYHITS